MLKQCNTHGITCVRAKLELKETKLLKIPTGFSDRCRILTVILILLQVSLI